MPKHFSNGPKGKHFAGAGTGDETTPLGGGGAPRVHAEPEAPAAPEQDAGATRLMAPDELPAQPDQDATRLMTPEDEGQASAEPLFPDVTAGGRPADDGFPEEPLGKHDVAAVQPDGKPYSPSQPSPYLSGRQARRDPAKAKHRHLVLIVIVLVLAAVASVAGGLYYIRDFVRPANQGTGTQFETAKITRGNFVDTIDATTTLSPANTADVTPQVTGTIKSLKVQDGSAVKRGDTLFTLDNAEITAAATSAKQQLDDANSELDGQNQQLQSDTATLDSLKGTMSESLSTIYSLVGRTPGTTAMNVDTDGDGTPDALDSTGDGKADGFDTNGDGIPDMVDTNGDGIPDAIDVNGDGKPDSATDVPSTLTPEQRTQLQSAETSYLSAQSQLKTAQGTVDSDNVTISATKDDVSKLQDAYDKAVDQQKKLTVTAPISGTIHNVSSALVEGGTISTTDKLCEVDDESSFTLTIQASEGKARKAQVGQDVALSFPDFSDLQATAKVTSVATSRTDGSDTFAVVATLSDPDERLSSGTTVNAQVILQEIDDVLIVPAAAVETSGRDSYLDVLLDPVRGIDTKVQVNVVASNEDNAVVEGDSIQEGNAVVLSKTN